MKTFPDRYLINSEMIDHTVQQIKKDLRLEAFPTLIPDPEKTPYEQIFAALMPEVEHLISCNIADLPQMIYQVDLPENEINHLMSAENASEKITDSIIKRCFQKVVTRRLYSVKRKP